MPVALLRAQLWDREYAGWTGVGSCTDLRRFEELYGLSELHGAERIARAVLAMRRGAVLSLAARLERERSITFERAGGRS